jgi:predicted secreted protein
MAATAGKKLRVQIATTLAGPYTNLVGVKSASLKRGFASIDVTTLTDSDAVKIQGMRDASLSISGNFELDTTGQKLIRDAIQNGTQLFIKFQPDGGTTAGINSTVEVIPTDYSISADASGEVSVSISLDCTGPVTVA